MEDILANRKILMKKKMRMFIFLSDIATAWKI